MKKTLIYIALVAIFSAVLLYSCEDEDTIRFNIDEFGMGFLPFFDWGEGSNPGFNPDELANSSVIVLVDLRAQETATLSSAATEVNSIDIKVIYDNLLSPLVVPDTGIVASVTSWPSEVTITPQNMVDALDSLSSINDMAAGDVFTLSQIINMKDGRTIDGVNDQNTIEVFDTAGNSIGDLTYSTYDNDLQINESGKNVYDWNVFVNCATELDGSYTMVTEGEGGYGFGDPAFLEPYSSEMEVTLSSVGLGVYQSTACMGGLMQYFYGAFGGELVVGNFIVLCDNSIQGVNIIDGWNFIQLTGSYEPTSGVITVSWENPWGDYGTSVYTPN